MTIKSDVPAKRFFHLLFPHERFDNTASKGKALIRAAFAAYEYEWRAHRYSIAKWQYPFDAVKAGAPFKGDEPWTVLFRRAVEIAEAEKPVAAETPVEAEKSVETLAQTMLRPATSRWVTEG